MKNTFFYITITVLLFLISSCNDCKNPTCPKLTTEETSWLPYNENDTLIFENSISDSLLIFPLKRVKLNAEFVFIMKLIKKMLNQAAIQE